MWAVYENRRVSKKLDSIPIEVLKRYEKWKEKQRLHELLEIDEYLEDDHDYLDLERGCHPSSKFIQFG